MFMLTESIKAVSGKQIMPHLCLLCAFAVGSMKFCFSIKLQIGQIQLCAIYPCRQSLICNLYSDKLSYPRTNQAKCGSQDIMYMKMHIHLGSKESTSTGKYVYRYLCGSAFAWFT